MCTMPTSTPAVDISGGGAPMMGPELTIFYDWLRRRGHTLQVKSQRTAK